jgi:hypothetical protein
MIRDSLSSFISRPPQSFERSAGSNRRFKFQKRSQLFVCTHNETLSVVAMRVGNPNRSPFAIHSRHTAPTPSGFAEIVGDDFPAVHLS